MVASRRLLLPMVLLAFLLAAGPSSAWGAPQTNSQDASQDSEAGQAFSLSAPSDATVLAGQTATYSVGVTLSGGTAAPVTLSVASGLPSGATATFTPSSVTSSGSSTLTIATSPSVALGDYMFTIQGQSGVLVQTITAKLHVYDFTVGLSPPDRTALRGSSPSYSVTLTLSSGSSTTGIPAIGLAASGLPGDAISEFGASNITPTLAGSSTTLTVTTGSYPAGSLGDFSFKVTGTDPSASGDSRTSGPARLHIYDFSVSVKLGDKTVLRGGSTVYVVNLTLTPYSATPSAIFLSAAGLPTGSTSSFLGSSVTPTPFGAISSFTVDTYTGAPGPTALGDFTLTVSGTDNVNPSGGSRQGSMKLHIYDFTLSVSPSDHTVLRGGSTSYAVTVKLVAGSSAPPFFTFGPPILLGVAGLPGDSTSSFSLAGVDPTLAGATSTLTVTTGSTSVGDYLLTVTGSAYAGDGSRSASPVNLHVYDFTVTAVPASLDVLTTGSNAYMISVALVPGSSVTGLPTIALSVAGLPAGATGVFGLASGTPGFASTLTITTSSALTGTYALTITAKDARSAEGARTASPTLVVLTPQQALLLVINQVNALKSDGALNGGQANSFLVKLNAAISSLNSGAPNTACNQLSAFVNEVNSYVAEGILTTSQANRLLGGTLGVNAIMAAIPC